MAVFGSAARASSTISWIFLTRLGRRSKRVERSDGLCRRRKLRADLIRRKLRNRQGESAVGDRVIEEHQILAPAGLKAAECSSGKLHGFHHQPEIVIG